MKYATAQAVLLFSALVAAAPVDVEKRQQDAAPKMPALSPVDVAPASGAFSSNESPAAPAIGKIPTGVFPPMPMSSGSSGVGSIESLLNGLKPKTKSGGLSSLLSGSKGAAGAAPAAIDTPLTTAPYVGNSTNATSAAYVKRQLGGASSASLPSIDGASGAPALGASPTLPELPSSAGAPKGGLAALLSGAGGSSASGAPSLAQIESMLKGAGAGASGLPMPDLSSILGSSAASPPSDDLEKRQGLSGLLSGGSATTDAAAAATSSTSGVAALESLDSSGAGPASASTSDVPAIGGSAETGSFSGACKDATMVFARGTGEPGGTLGAIVGPELTKALTTDLGGNFESQGVPYSAGIAGDVDLGTSGAGPMATTMKSVLAKCPNTKIILGGYSQGAMVIHSALSSGKIDGSKVSAVVAFGDPFNGQSFKGVDDSKVVRYCGVTDIVCDHSGVKNAAGSHLAYGASASAAAAKVAAIIKSEG